MPEHPATVGVDRLAVAFARVLRSAGLTVPVDSTVTFTEALDAIGVADRPSVYWSGRATLVTHPEDVPVYDAAFSAFWDRTELALGGPVLPAKQAVMALDAEGEAEDDASDGDPGDQDVRVRYSRTEVLRHKDFAACTAAELDEAHRLMRRLRAHPASRRSHRRVPARRKGRWPDLRRTTRDAIRAGGEPMRRAWHEPGVRARPIVFLLDVSGSMDPYARALLRFVHAAVAGRRRVEAFVLGTRLTRISRELASRDPDRALEAVTEVVPDWAGGTRLGDGIRQFCDDWGVPGVARGAVVVILSDGWDRGDPELLGDQMERLSRVAYRVVWVNPLKATPGYEPLAAGMAAALPHVDRFVTGHSLAALEALADLIADDAAGRR